MVDATAEMSHASNIGNERFAVQLWSAFGKAVLPGILSARYKDRGNNDLKILGATMDLMELGAIAGTAIAITAGAPISMLAGAGAYVLGRIANMMIERRSLRMKR